MSDKNKCPYCLTTHSRSSHETCVIHLITATNTNTVNTNGIITLNEFDGSSSASLSSINITCLKFLYQDQDSGNLTLEENRFVATSDTTTVNRKSLANCLQISSFKPLRS